MIELEGAQVTGLAEAVSMLLGVQQRATNYTPLLELDMQDQVRKFFLDQFQTYGQAGGSPWLPLSAFTQRVKQSLGFGSKGILRRTDTLFNSLTQKDATLSTAEVDATSLEQGTSDPKAILHQEGFGRLPQRQIVPDEIPDVYTNQWSSLVLDYAEGT